MPVKIRLAKHGGKKKPYYHIVVADSRAPRDGRYIERIGSYNPLTNPATIDLNFDKALNWLQKGALPTDTCRSILSHSGVLMKKHLLEGVKKGAFSAEEAETRFENWKREKQLKLDSIRQQTVKAKEEILKKRIKEEEKINEARKAELAKKQLEEARKAESANAEEESSSAATDESASASDDSAAETTSEN